MGVRAARWHDVTAARVLEQYVLEVTFDGTEQRFIDVKPLMWGPAFERLRQDYAAFCQVSVDAEAGTIVWPGDLDLSPDLLYELSSQRQQ